MSADKHTPGPWRIGTPPPNGEQTIGTQQGLMVAVATTSAGIPTEANAHLIAAAPDLLEALEIVAACSGPDPVTFYKEDGWRWTHRDGSTWEIPGSWDEPPPLHPVALAAIAKARGGA